MEKCARVDSRVAFQLFLSWKLSPPFKAGFVRQWIPSSEEKRGGFLWTTFDNNENAGKKFTRIEIWVPFSPMDPMKENNASQTGFQADRWAARKNLYFFIHGNEERNPTKPLPWGVRLVIKHALKGENQKETWHSWAGGLGQTHLAHLCNSRWSLQAAVQANGWCGIGQLGPDPHSVLVLSQKNTTRNLYEEALGTK